MMRPLESSAWRRKENPARFVQSVAGAFCVGDLCFEVLKFTRNRMLGDSLRVGLRGIGEPTTVLTVFRGRKQK